MESKSKYIVVYTFELDGIELYINKKDSFGIKEKNLKDLSLLQYGNIYGDRISIKIDWKKSKITKESGGSYLMNSLYGTINIGFPKDLGKNYDYRKFDSYFRCFVHLIFFILNISLPGSFDVGRCKYKFANMGLIKYNESKKPYKVSEIFEQGGEFNILGDERFYQMYQQKIIKVDEISLKKVSERTQKFGLWFNPLSSEENRLESAIFGLFHLFLNENLGNESLLQVFYLSQILEAIYSTPEDRIMNTLFNRIKILIKIDEVTIKKLKKIINKFYNLRSKYVHGEYNINNPILFDNFIDDEHGIRKIWDDIMEKDIDVIYAIVFASFQKIIEKGLTKIEFEEKLIV
ncbi:MAG: hypothetical protein WC010_02620 [Candidatus Absconditabacterales bacterium]